MLRPLTVLGVLMLAVASAGGCNDGEDASIDTRGPYRPGFCAGGGSCEQGGWTFAEGCVCGPDCGRDADCPAPGAGFEAVCLYYEGDGQAPPMGGCVMPCEADADCPAEMICGAIGCLWPTSE